MPPARHQAAFVDFICPNNQPGKKQRIQKLDTTSSKSHCLVLITQNSGQKKEVNLGPSPKKGSDKTNMYKQERNIQKKASCIEQPGSHMDPSTQKGRLEIQCKEKNQ